MVSDLAKAGSGTGPTTDQATEEKNRFRDSSLYREFQAEREEILRHKWLESEKVGHDIGFEQALTDWIVKHRSKWRKHYRETMRRQHPESTN